MKGFTTSSSDGNSPSELLPSSSSSSLASYVDDKKNNNNDNNDSSTTGKSVGSLSSKFTGLMSQLAKKDTIPLDSEDLSMNEQKS
jgi:hypothetical protein